MALEFGFYDSYDHDRLYNAENMNDIFEGVITDGVYAGVGDMFAVKPSIGLQVTVGTGRAWFKSTWNKNRTMAPVNLDVPDPVYDRIDTLCIRVQKNILERRNDFFVYKGAILTTPQPPILQNTDETFYLPLANITVRANAEEILVSDIEILVGRDSCPFVTSIIQQTDITDLFARWEGQFTEWWNGVKDILSKFEEGDVGFILSELESKVNRSDKAEDEDISLNSDSKWMTPAKTKQMITDAVGDIGETLENGVVSSFNGRKGAVDPQKGDYTADDVGALSLEGGIVFGELGVVNAAKFNSTVDVKGTLRLKGDKNYGNVLNFGDGDNVYISEPTEDKMEIKAEKINFITKTDRFSFLHNDRPICFLDSELIATTSVFLPGNNEQSWQDDKESSVISIPKDSEWLLIMSVIGLNPNLSTKTFIVNWNTVKNSNSMSWWIEDLTIKGGDDGTGSILFRMLGFLPVTPSSARFIGRTRMIAFNVGVGFGSNTYTINVYQI